MRNSSTGCARLAPTQEWCWLFSRWPTLGKPQASWDTALHEGDVKIAGAAACHVVGCAGQRRHAVQV
ncbi:hypothetical protein BRL99_09320, partial [Xanthomonas oryzae pv. oryzae]